MSITTTALTQSIPISAVVDALLKQPELLRPELIKQVVESLKPSMDLLNSQPLPIKPISSSSANSLQSLTNSNFIEAQVLSNTLLKSVKGENQFQIKISVGTQQFELTSKTPIDTGTRLQLQLQDNNTAVIVKVLAKSSQTTAQANATNNQPLALQTGNATPNNNPARTNGPSTTVTLNSLTPNSLLNSASNPTIRQSAISSASQTAQGIQQATPEKSALLKATIDQAIRNTLPIQKPLREAIPLLQQTLTSIASQPRQQSNVLIAQTIQKLIRQIPTADNIQQPLIVKQAINNSGVNFEAKLAKILLDNKQANSETNQNKINLDNKGLLLKISQLINSQNNVKSTNNNQALPSSSDPAINALYTSKPEPNNTANQTLTKVSTEQNLDIMLKQLSRMIMSSIARTQLHQLETLITRQPISADQPTPANNLILEIPIINGKHIDNLELRIKQENQKNASQQNKKTEKLWTVTLNFDLHALGKLHAQVKILDKSVAATLWAQNEDTHIEVKQHLQELKQSLEKVGVTVKQLEAKLGSPPEQASPLQRQLVDVRT